MRMIRYGRNEHIFPSPAYQHSTDLQSDTAHLSTSPMCDPKHPTGSSQNAQDQRSKHITTNMDEGLVIDLCRDDHNDPVSEPTCVGDVARTTGKDIIASFMNPARDIDISEEDIFLHPITPVHAEPSDCSLLSKSNYTLAQSGHSDITSAGNSRSSQVKSSTAICITTNRLTTDRSLCCFQCDWSTNCNASYVTHIFLRHRLMTCSLCHQIRNDSANQNKEKLVDEANASGKI